MIPVILGVSFIVFILMHLTPGDPVDMMLGEYAPAAEVQRVRDMLGLNDPLPVQYANFLLGALQGDLGQSIYFRVPVTELIQARIGYTFRLSLLSMMISYLIAFPVGILSAVRQNTVVDDVGMVGALLGVSMPNFWLGIMLILLFSYQLRWFPASGREGFVNIIMPAITLGTSGMATVTRITRSSMLEVIRQDYVRTARAKGLSERKVVYKHALKCALISVITVVGLQMGFWLGGTVIVETVFAWPGVGRFAFQRMMQRDYPMIMGNLLLFATLFCVVNLLVDLAYGLADPRIRYD